MYFSTTHYVGHIGKPYYGRHQNYVFLSFLSKMMVIYIDHGLKVETTRPLGIFVDHIF